MKSSRGFTLVELLCVIGALAIICTISVPAIKHADIRSKQRADDAMVLVYNQAMENFRINDFSAFSKTIDQKVTFEENGRVKYNSVLNLTTDEISALANSGRGLYPQTKAECMASIKLYTGDTSKVGIPSVGESYDFYYHLEDGKVAVMRKNDIPVSQRNYYISLSGS